MVFINKVPAADDVEAARRLMRSVEEVLETHCNILGLSEKRPNTLQAFRMLCRHNRYVQEFGKVRDLHEISRREEIWLRFVEAMEERNEMTVGATGASQFQQELERYLDLETFAPREPREGMEGPT